MANDNRRAPPPAGISKPGKSGGSSQNDRRGAAQQEPHPNEAVIRGAEERLELESLRAQTGELKRQVSVLSSDCATMAGEVAKGNLIIKSKDAIIADLEKKAKP